APFGVTISGPLIVICRPSGAHQLPSIESARAVPAPNTARSAPHAAPTKTVRLKSVAMNPSSAAPTNPGETAPTARGESIGALGTEPPRRQVNSRRRDPSSRSIDGLGALASWRFSPAHVG